VLAALAILGAGAVWAEKADRDQPMHIEADAMRYEDARGAQPRTATFTGHVVVTKGTIVMRGDKLTVRQDAAGNQSGVMTPVPGQRAFFRQKRDGADEFIEGQADRMEYNGEADTVHLIGNAEMQRLAGAKVVDNVKGGLIVYNGNTEVYTADSAPAPAAGGKPGRVRAILAPQGAGRAAGTATDAKSGQSKAAIALPLQAASALPPAVAPADAGDQQ